MLLFFVKVKKLRVFTILYIQGGSIPFISDTISRSNCLVNT